MSEMNWLRRTVWEFAKRYGLELTVSVSYLNGRMRWLASYKGVETLSDGILCSDTGSGMTPGEAIDDYGDKIADKLLVEGAYSTSRREFYADKTFAECTKEEMSRYVSDYNAAIFR